MPHYLFHAYADHEAIDEEGANLSGDDAAKAHAIKCARDMMKADIDDGLLDLSHRIEVEGESGEVVFVVYYRDAIEVRGAYAEGSAFSRAIGTGRPSESNTTDSIS